MRMMLVTLRGVSAVVGTCMFCPSVRMMFVGVIRESMLVMIAASVTLASGDVLMLLLPMMKVVMGVPTMRIIGSRFL